MRKGVIAFLIVNLIVIGFLVNAVFTLITLLFEDCSADAIHSSEIPAPNSILIDQRPQLIPKIIHQTWQNETIPEKWQAAQQSCVDLHSDYEYKVSLLSFRGGKRKRIERNISRKIERVNEEKEAVKILFGNSVG